MAHITFIHGMANKPAEGVLHDLWLRALAHDDGLDCNTEGITSSMVYWADVLYAEPQAHAEDLESGDELVEARQESGIGDESPWRAGLSPEEQRFVGILAARLGADLPDEVAPAAETLRGAGPSVADNLGHAEMIALETLERIPLPWAIKRPLMKRLLRDVHHYLFNVQFSPRPGHSYSVQTEIRNRVMSKLRDGAARTPPHVVVSHSMGTVIAYDCLKRLDGCPAIDALVTLGSPLGLDEIQDQLMPGFTSDDGFPGAVRSAWVNVFDPLDPVAGFDPRFRNDYLRANTMVVEDISESNWGSWRHSITKYLRGPKLRRRLTELLLPTPAGAK